MLRIHRKKPGRRASASIRVDYADPYLALTSLLVDAATLEHSLLSMYLYAMFSLKPRYADVRGALTRSAFQPQPPGLVGQAGQPTQRKLTFLDVTIEEMQHLAIVNQLLYELGAAPCLERHSFPHQFEIYPFKLDLRPLSRFSAATFTWIEAASAELDPSAAADGREPALFIAELERAVNEGAEENVVRRFKDEHLEHLGSLYGVILERLDTLRADPPPFLSETFAWGAWTDRIDWIRNQGEIDHYRFFRSLFDGSAFGNPEIWSLPKDSPEYPAVDLPWQTAFGSRTQTIKSRPARDLAWLSNLIYWGLLCLLDVSYRSNNRKLIYVAIEQMASALWCLGLSLQEYGVGMPFDIMLVRYNLGRDDNATLAIITRLVLEARGRAEELGKQGLLPKALDLGMFERTLAALRDPGGRADRVG